MKKAIAAVILSLSLVLGTGVAASATSVADTIHVTIPRVDTSLVECVGLVGWGFTSVAGAFYGPVTIFSWLGIGSTAASASIAAINKTCAADSFYNHIGYKKLCWDRHFLYWAPTSGLPIFDVRNIDKACTYRPLTMDQVFCGYITPLEPGCIRQAAIDAWFGIAW